MNGCSQRFVINKSVSSWRPITSSVAKRSILGLILVNVFISDLSLLGPMQPKLFCDLFCDFQRDYYLFLSQVVGNDPLGTQHSFPSTSTDAGLQDLHLLPGAGRGWWSSPGLAVLWHYSCADLLQRSIPVDGEKSQCLKWPVLIF